MTPMQRLAGVGQVPGSVLIVSGFLRVFLGLTFIYAGLQKLTDSGFLGWALIGGSALAAVLLGRTFPPAVPASLAVELTR